MPRWVSGLGHVLGLLDRWFDSLCCSYFFTFFATQLLMLSIWFDAGTLVALWGESLISALSVPTLVSSSQDRDTVQLHA